MNYFVNENVELMQIKSIWLLLNFDNQAVIGLDAAGLLFWRKVESKGIVDVDIEKNRDLYNALFELDFLKKTPIERCKDDLKITSAYVHLLNRCNLNCLGCYSMNDQRNIEKDASTEQWKLGLSRLAEAGINSVVISGGEPLLRKDIVELVKYAKDEIGIESITLITNGTVDFPFVQLKNYVDTIAVSVDGYDKTHSSFIRDQGISTKVINTIKTIRDLEIDVSIVPTLHMKNYKAMKKYDELAEKLGVQISFSILSVPYESPFQEYVLDDNALAYIAKELIHLNAEMENDIRTSGEGLCAMRSCGMACNMISVDSVGNIYPCHILHDKRLLLGNIFERPLVMENLDTKILMQCKEINVDNIEGCKKCDYRYLCGGGCRGRAFLKSQNLSNKDPYCCLFRQFYQIEMNTILQGLTNENK